MRCKLWPDLAVEKAAKLGAHGGEFGGGWRIGEWGGFQQAHRAELEALAEHGLTRITEDELRAAAAHVEDERGLVAQRCVREHALKCPVGLLLTADDFDPVAAGAPDGVEQVRRVGGIPRGTRGDDANASRTLLVGETSEVRDRLGGVRDGFGAKTVILVEASTQAGLLAAFPDWLNGVMRNIRDEQLHGVGPDVDDGAALGMANGKWQMANR